MSSPAHAIAAETMVSAIRVRPRMSFLEWAPLNVADENGPFRFRPYQVLPAASIFNPGIYSLSLRMYSGGGKTYLFTPAITYAISQLNLNVGVQFPAIKQSEKWLRKKLRPFLEHTKAVTEIGMLRSVADEIEFANGASIDVSGANSGGATRTMEVHWTYADEIDAIIQDAGDEGDKLKAFEKRTRGRGIQIHTRCSYPSVKGRSQIDTAFDESDGCFWHYECPKCGELQAFHPDHIVHLEGQPEAAEVECPACAGVFGDEERRESALVTGCYINRDGETVGIDDLPSDTYGRNRGIHVNCMAHVGAHDPSRRNYLHEIAAQVAAIPESTDPEKARRVFINTMAAESYELQFESKASFHILTRRRENYDPRQELPEGVLCITGGGDTNKRFLNATLKGWGINGESWGLDYVEFPGNVDDPDTWKAYWKWVFREWKHPLGVPMNVSRFFLDTRYRKSISRREVRKNGKGIVRAIVGASGASALGAPIIHTKKTDAESGVVVQTIGTHEAKDTINQRLQLEPPKGDEPFPENFMHYAATNAFSSLYFQQLTESEQSVLKQGTDGEFYPYYTKTAECENGTLRNEPLDCEVYALAAKLSLNPNFSALESLLAKRAEQAAATTTKKPSSRRRKSFVGGFS